ncbi:MAG: DUF2460 domain-containing protein [Sphingosinicella sp.]|nr:DUF2460 domain-containing protein [Sphingosinicella sp.]
MHWLAKPGTGIRRDWLKRFDARYWTVDFARPAMGSVVTTAADALRVDAAFYTANDLVGLIWESADRWDHPLIAYETRRDYRGTQLSFRWRSEGDCRQLPDLDGPTLTIEGRDAEGNPRSWYVRLWNYAEGAPDDAVIRLDFDAMDGGFLLPGEADPVWAGDIDRMFISVVPDGYTREDVPLAAPGVATIRIEEMRCDGPSSVLEIGDACLPPHRLRMAGGFDDSYTLTPERVLGNALKLGYREWFNHYVGMSHYFRLGWDGARFVVATEGDPLNAPCRVWHADFCARGAALGYKVILSLSYELFDAHAPEDWKQRAGDGSPALTGWDPPSTLLSPANDVAMAWLRGVGEAFAGFGAPWFQIGEPWWWTGFGADRTPCFHDTAATAAYAAETGLAAPPAMADVSETPSAAQAAYHAWLGGKLGASTLALRDAVKDAAPGTEVALLFYVPQVLRSEAAWLAAVNMPVAWAYPAFDVLQLEDYDFVTDGNAGGMRRARAAVSEALGYAAAEQHYFSGFVLNGTDRHLWQPIAAAAEDALVRGVAETFVWAFPQVMRDGFTFFEIEEDAALGFHDVAFPLALAEGVSGGPLFSTQVVTSVSGYEQRNSDWAQARLRYDAGPGVRSEDDLATLIAFFRARRGRAFAFRFRDPFDFSSNGMTGAPSPLDQTLGAGDGVRTVFALVKRYGEGEARRITRPDVASVRVAVAGTELMDGWLLEGGSVTFDIPPTAAVTAGFLFDVPVRFAEDSIEASLQGWRAGEMPSAPIIEVREA